MQFPCAERWLNVLFPLTMALQDGSRRPVSFTRVVVLTLTRTIKSAVAGQRFPSLFLLVYATVHKSYLLCGILVQHLSSEMRGNLWFPEWI